MNVPSLLALDVDGTLLTSDGELSVRTRHALRDADRAGWHVALITGRPLPYVLPVARKLGVGQYVVAANGSTVAEIDTGAVLYQSSISGELVRTALSAVRAVAARRLRRSHDGARVRDGTRLRCAGAPQQGRCDCRRRCDPAARRCRAQRCAVRSWAPTRPPSGHRSQHSSHRGSTSVLPAYRGASN